MILTLLTAAAISVAAYVVIEAGSYNSLIPPKYNPLVRMVKPNASSAPRAIEPTVATEHHAELDLEGQQLLDSILRDSIGSQALLDTLKIE